MYIVIYRPTPRYSPICYTRTNRYDCVSLRSFSLSFFFFLSVHIYISCTRTLSISRSLPLPSPLFFLQSSISFFHPYPSYVLVIEAIFQLAGLTEAISSPLAGREFSRNAFTGSPSHSLERRRRESREKRGRSMRRN